jgi:hypothetical protein
VREREEMEETSEGQVALGHSHSILSGGAACMWEQAEKSTWCASGPSPTVLPDLGVN